jgi:putative NADPH-quinone reductase
VAGEFKVVAIGGSPRRNGNSNSLLRIAVEAAEERGAAIQCFYPSDLHIAGCLACQGCRRTPESTCVQQDDMQQLYTAIKECDVLVVASPVYFYSLSSWVKAVLDRGYALITPGAEETGGEDWPRRVPPGKGFYFISTQAEESPFYGYQILSSVVYGFTWTNIALLGHLVATGLDGPHDWEAREDLITAARELIAVP